MGAAPGDEPRNSRLDVLTRIEKNLAERVSLLFSRALEERLSPLGIHPGSNGDAILPTNMVLELEYSVSFSASRGSFFLWVPCVLAQELLEEMGETPDSPLPDVYFKPPWRDEETRQAPLLDVSESLKEAKIAVSVQLFGGKITPRELLEWETGDVVSLEKPADAPFEVLVESVPKFSAAPGRVKNRKAFKIL